MKAVKFSYVKCISTFLPYIVSNVHAPKTCLRKVILLDLIFTISLNFLSFFFSECSFSMEMMQRDVICFTIEFFMNLLQTNQVHVVLGLFFPFCLLLPYIKVIQNLVSRMNYRECKDVEHCQVTQHF